MLCVFFKLRLSAGDVSDESDGVSIDEDLADPFYRNESHTSLIKGFNGKSKKKAKRAGIETMQDKKAKVPELCSCNTV